MRIENVEEADGERDEDVRSPVARRVDASLGRGGRPVLFYPTLLYNVCRSKIQVEFRWWDEVDQYILLGAVPFSRHVPRLQQLGVGGVITLTEPFETLAPSSLYRAQGIENLVIPTRDYFFAPSYENINRAVDFIHRKASSGQTTYVHCKAGRGRSTTIVLCYLVKHKQMTPEAALNHVRSKRPRVLLNPTQSKAVHEYSKRQSSSSTPLCHSSSEDEVVHVTEADLEGFSSSSNDDDNSRKELAVVPKVSSQQPMINRLSSLFARQ